MGSILEINDTLTITSEQGFPDYIFNLERHRANPVTLADVSGMEFEFSGKTSPRFFHLDPVRVYWIQKIEGRWLAWGQIVVRELRISPNPNYTNQSGEVNVTDPAQWVTSGKYKIHKIYDPDYQESFTRNDLPPALSYFTGRL